MILVRLLNKFIQDTESKVFPKNKLEKGKGVKIKFIALIEERENSNNSIV